MSFAGKIVLVTGGGQGIGNAIAERLASEGAAIAIADIDPRVGEDAAAALRVKGAAAIAVACDVADEISVDAALAQVTEQFGGVDILINNAGKHLLDHAVPITKLSREKWRLMLNVNVIGIVNCAAACRPSMKQRGGGVIINIGSTAGIAGNTCYGVSKLAVRGLTVGLAQEFAGDNIRVCAVAPGLVDTPAAMAEIPQARRDQFVNDLQLVKRPGRMSDVANTVRFLCSEEAAFITGETVVIGGGYPLYI